MQELSASNDSSEGTQLEWNKSVNTQLDEGGSDCSEEVVELASRQRSTPWFMTLMNLIKTYLGSGLLSLPYAYNQGGLTATIATIAFVGAVSCHCMYILVECKRCLKERGINVVTFGDVGEATFGKAGLYLVNLMLLFTQYGFCCVYVVFVSQNTITLLSSYFEGGQSTPQWHIRFPSAHSHPCLTLCRCRELPHCLHCDLMDSCVHWAFVGADYEGALCSECACDRCHLRQCGGDSCRVVL